MKGTRSRLIYDVGETELLYMSFHDCFYLFSVHLLHCVLKIYTAGEGCVPPCSYIIVLEKYVGGVGLR